MRLFALMGAREADERSADGMQYPLSGEELKPLPVKPARAFCCTSTVLVADRSVIPGKEKIEEPKEVVRSLSPPFRAATDLC